MARLIRLGIAAAFVVLAGWVILASAARSLDAQGDDRLERLVRGGATELHWAQVSGKMVDAKAPLDAAALAELRREAVRNPLSAMPYFLTGVSRKLGGDAAGGARLADLAVSRDPRFMPARYWKIHFAAERGEIEQATAATLRAIVLDPDSLQSTAAILVQLTRSQRSWPQIRAALPDAGDWREVYYNKLVEAGFEPSIVFSVIDVVHASGKPLSPREQNALLAKMADSADFERAYIAWINWLPPEARNKIDYLYDGGFNGGPGGAPFNWTYAANSDGSGAIDKERGLRFDYSGAVNIDIATETMLIPPGRYRLSSVAALDETLAGDSSVPVSWQLLCRPKGDTVADLHLANSTAVKNVAVEFEIPEGCGAQQLSLHGIAPELPTRVGGYVRAVKIEKVK